MVGVVGYYGQAQEEGQCPERLDCRYVAQMPEDRAVTFKARFEAELEEAMDKLYPDVLKLVLCDGAPALWNYIDKNERFKHFHKLIDYWHALEHLSRAAEALFGKGSKAARAWYAKHAKKLKEKIGGAQSVLNSMDYYAGTLNLS